MDDIWDKLTEELACHGIKLINAQDCAIYYNGKFGLLSIDKVLISLRKRIISNGHLFEEIWSDFIGSLEKKDKIVKKEPLDDLLINMFINTIKDAYVFAEFLTSSFTFNDGGLRSSLCPRIRTIMNNDYAEFSKSSILSSVSYKLSLDWIFRKIQSLVHVRTLLRIAQKGPNRLRKVKVARGVSGPWANLDLPMLERVYPWADIAEEMEGRRSDIRKQQRYRAGFEYYNDPYGRAPNYWREMRNEPFSWADRGSESPYPSRNLLSKWGGMENIFSIKIITKKAGWINQLPIKEEKINNFQTWEKQKIGENTIPKNIAGKVQSLIQEYGEPGSQIPGSSYVRWYCCGCGVPMRISGNMAKSCRYCERCDRTEKNKAQPKTTRHQPYKKTDEPSANWENAVQTWERD